MSATQYARLISNFQFGIRLKNLAIVQADLVVVTLVRYVTNLPDFTEKFPVGRTHVEPEAKYKKDEETQEGIRK